jgi:hypothetical protein
MLSLRRFWPAADREIDPADLMRVVRLLLQGIALHAVEGAPLDYKTFRQDIQRQSEIVEANPGPAELLVSLAPSCKLWSTIIHAPRCICGRKRRSCSR